MLRKGIEISIKYMVNQLISHPIKQEQYLLQIQYWKFHSVFEKVRRSIDFFFSKQTRKKKKWQRVNEGEMLRGYETDRKEWMAL